MESISRLEVPVTFCLKGFSVKDSASPPCNPLHWQCPWWRRALTTVHSVYSNLDVQQMMTLFQIHTGNDYKKDFCLFFSSVIKLQRISRYAKSMYVYTAVMLPHTD